MAARLPDRPYVFNLCENRYLFCLVLLAAASRGQLCLMPPSSLITVIREIAHDYPGAYLAGERSPDLPNLDWFEVAADGSEELALETDFDWNCPALVIFTSGSTGKPKPCIHNLATFRISAQLATSSLNLGLERQLMISTTPPQHMYGLETSVFWPLFTQLIMYDERPFFPADISRVLETSPWPAVLATTPTHLRALTKANVPWTKLVGILSATDALSEKLAQETYTQLGISPYEIYGSTETLSFASREPLRESLWQPYQNIRLGLNECGQARLESPHLAVSTVLQDSFKISANGQFALQGRDLDLIKIGGKRASLAELNRRLNDIEGVADGFCYMLHDEQGDGRLAAVVVSQLDKQTIRKALQAYLDEVFLPRKIHYVSAIPRNAVGKLTKAEMDSILAGLA
jgi:acyl-coenzyme A synthetase/AMP-(fatty) acid ligase